MNSQNAALVQYCLRHCDITKMSKNYLKKYFRGISEGEGNSMAAEQIMNKFDGFTHTVQSMDFVTMRFFLFWLCVDLNEIFARRHPKMHCFPGARPFY